MQHENMQRLADFLRALPAEQFDMSLWKGERECGTVGCVAGWATELADCYIWRKDAHKIDYSATAATWLGLGVMQSTILFWQHASWQTPTEAADEIERMIAADKRYEGQWLRPLHDIISEMIDSGEIDLSLPPSDYAPTALNRELVEV